MKTRENLFELIHELDTTIHNLESEYDVDQGGCLWVCYVLAKNLEERNLNYKVVVYADGDATSRDVETILKNEELWHMSISVSGKEIGGEIEQDLLKEHNILKFTTRLTSDEILDFYNKYEFNQSYNKESNEIVEDEITTTFRMVW